MNIKMSIWRILFLFVIMLGVEAEEIVQPQKVILLLVDGLRWDSFGVELPGLKKVADNGVKADWLDGVFITMTTPSTYSIATGLYPESHGVLHNLYFNKTTKEKTSRFQDALNMTEWFDTSAEPMWVTAKLANKKVGSILYIGTSVPIKGIEPDRVVPLAPYFWNNYSLRNRVTDAVSWIMNEDFDLIMLYFNQPDFILHSYRSDNDFAISALFDVDKEIDRLFNLLDENGLDDVVNVLIVSDHGHIDLDPRKFICLYDYIDESDVDFIVADYGPLFQLAPKEGKFQKVYTALKSAHPALNVYQKEEFPNRLHYANNDRNLPIIGFVDPGWHLHTTFNPLEETVAGSDHGYDNKWMVMKSSFYAKGPSFKQGYRAEPLESVDVYQMVCDILRMDAAPNNGSRERYLEMLRTSGASFSSSVFYTNSLVMTVICLICNVR